MYVSKRQDERREGTRVALLDVAARLISRHGLRAITLERIAREAGYTRGAAYHLYRSKDELAIAALAWIVGEWGREVGPYIEAAADPVQALYEGAARHAVFCRRDVARIAMSLRYEFTDRHHPIGAAIATQYEQIHADIRMLIEAAQAAGRIDPGMLPATLSEAYVGALEGVVIATRGEAPLDAVLSVRAIAGLLGLAPASAEAYLSETGFT